MAMTKAQVWAHYWRLVRAYIAYDDQVLPADYFAPHNITECHELDQHRSYLADGCYRITCDEAGS